MIALHVTVPIACFRKGLAREYLETEPLPPPATCYGFLLSLVGETDRRSHLGCRVAPGLLNRPQTSVVLRTVWRVKKTPLGSPGNTRPDFQQLLTGPSAESPFVEVLVFLDSSEEQRDRRLEDRVLEAIKNPASVTRFGGLCLGESTHLVDEVNLLDDARRHRLSDREPRVFLIHPRGRMSLPVWVDHVGSAGTRYETGNLERLTSLDPFPERERLPLISHH